MQLGAAAGWVGLLGVFFVIIVAPMAIAGQPPTTSSTLAEQLAYFGHPALEPFAVLGALVSVAIIPFALGLRAALREPDPDGAPGVFADVGLGLVVATVPLYLISEVLATALVGAAGRDPGTFATLFRAYEVLYNGAADVFEGAWIAAFSVAMLGGAYPRWIAWLGIVVGASRWLKAFAPFVPSLGAIDLPGGLLFLVWFAATVIALTRVARSANRSPAVRMPAPA
jgi:hypothetical protein